MQKNEKGLYPWPDDVKAELRELRAKGLTYNQIGALWKISAHAISGMGNRMGLPLVLLRVHKQKPADKVDRKHAENMSGAAAVEAAKRRSVKREELASAPALAPSLVCEAADPIPYEGMDLPPLDGCCAVERVGKRWSQCGKPVVSRRNPFCAEHAAKFYLEKPSMKPRAATAGAS